MVGAKPAKFALHADCGSVAGNENRAVARFDHLRRHFARQVQETHDIHPKVPFEHLRLDFEKRSPPTSHSVMDQHTRGSVRVSNVRNGFRDLAFARDVANDRVGIGEFLL